MPAPTRTPGPERVWLATAFVAQLAVVTVVGLTGVVGRVVGGAPWPPVPFALGTIAAVAAFGALSRGGAGPLAPLAARLPERLDGSFRRRPVRGVLVVLLAVTSIAQIGRVACFMSDDALRWASAFPPIDQAVEHMCQGSYVQAADLVRQGVPNVYEEQHYPTYRGSREAEHTPSRVDHIDPYIMDAFEYPPPFLLLPRLGLALTNDFMVLRTGWFMIQVWLFLAFALLLVRRLGDDAALVALLLVPVLLASMPLLFTFQYGQWHLAAIVLGMAGMVAFSGDRHALGGALLAAAVVTKIFPGVLVLYLLVRRRWVGVAWTAVFAGLYSLLALAVLGPDPFVAFFTYHLPRIASGEALRFFLRSNLTIAGNFAVYGFPFKLQVLGVPGMSQELASGLSWAYGLIVLGVAVVAAWRTRPEGQEPAIWLALLLLASLRSPLAPSAYVTAPALWLLTLVASRLGARTRGVVLIVVCWFVLGNLPPLPSPQATIALWMTGPVAMLALGFWAALARPQGGPGRVVASA